MEEIIERAIQSITGQTVSKTDADAPEAEYNFHYGDTVSFKVYIDAEAAAVVGFALIGQLPESERQAGYRHLLEANLLFRDTYGATLAADTGVGDVFIQKEWPFPLVQADTFVEELKVYIQTAIAWSEKVTVFASAQAEGDKPSPVSQANIRV